MTSAVALADLGNAGVIASAVLATAAVAAYAIRARGPRGGWWKTPTGRHLMCFMAAFAWVLDLAVIRLVTGPGPAWFGWLRGLSFATLIPAVLGWRLALVLRPPRLHPPLDGQGSQRQAEAEPCGRGSSPASEPGLRGERDGSTQEGYSRSVDPDHPSTLSLALILRPPR